MSKIETTKRIVRTSSEFNDILDIMQRRAEVISIDVETSGIKPDDGLNPWVGYLVGVGIACKLKGDDRYHAIYLPMVVENPAPYGAKLFTNEDLRWLLNTMPENVVWLMHNAKFDLKWLELATGFRWKPDTLRDPMVEMWMYRADEPQNLKDLTYRFYPERDKPKKFSDLLGKGKSKKKLEEVELDLIADYCMDDAINTILIAKRLKEEIQTESPRVWEVYRELEMPMTRLLTDMELRGVQIDVAALGDMAERLYIKKETIDRELKAVADINWNSNKQVIPVLEDLGVELPNARTAKGAQKLDREILLSVEKQHPCISHLLDSKEVNKIISTYIEGFLEQMDADGRVHADFGQTSTRTGRLSCRKPNLQNIPSDSFKKKDSRLRDEYKMLRALFVGDPLICVDLSQIEMRFAAHFSEDEALMDIYLNDLDLHQYTSDRVTKGDRTLAKNVNFGFLYGQRARGLTNITDLTLAEAKVFIADFERTYRGLLLWTKLVEAHARMNGYVTTILGRRRYLPNIRSEDWFLASEDARKAVNTIVQGSAADYLKVAMLNIEKGIETFGFQTVLQVHDELMFAPFREVSSKEVSGATQFIQWYMENAMELKVPVKAEPKVVTNWAQAK